MDCTTNAEVIKWIMLGLFGLASVGTIGFIVYAAIRWG